MNLKSLLLKQRQMCKPVTIAATGTTAADAATCSEEANIFVVTGADDAVGICLPDSVPGRFVIVKNTVANKILKVYNSRLTAASINAHAADAEESMAASTAAIFIAADRTHWYTWPLLPS